MIDPHIRKDILAYLAEAAAKHDVRLLFAVESGSRAWGFPSRDSDYDIRFVYCHRPEWYLSINVENRRDVIERPCDELIDLSGWDIRKALRLFLKSNPPLLEWLDSPIVYTDELGFKDALRGLLPEFHSPISAMHHYLHMARGNNREYLAGETVKLKKYFYVVRPLLASRWIAEGRGPVPMEYARLLEILTDFPEARGELGDLLARKLAGDELDAGPRLPAVHAMIATELPRLEALAADLSGAKGDVERLNALFRKTLTRAWA